MEVQRVHTNSGYLDGQKPIPWSFWPTIGFSSVIAVAYLFSGVIVSVVFVVVAKIKNTELDIGNFAQSLDSNGLFLAILTCAGTPLVVGLCVLFAKIRRKITVKQYLCLYKPGWKELCKWSLVCLLFVGCSDALTFFVGRPIVSEFMVSAYTTAVFSPLLWFALIIASPLYEEVFFRGFLFKGIENSRIGPIGAVIITSLAWSALHIQYDAYGIATIFVGGLLLGWVRLKSNSIYMPIAMHALWNLIATIEVIIYLTLV